MLVKNKVLESELLAKIKIDSVSLADLLKSTKKRGRKPYSEMSDNELYEVYLENCEENNKQVLSKELWIYLNRSYSFEELLSTDEILDNDPRHREETYIEKCMSIVKEGLDVETYITLAKVLYKALQSRLVIILQLDNVPALLNNAVECQHLDINCHSVNLAMKAKLNEVRNLLSNKEIQVWIKEKGISDMSLYNTESLLSDYITTYQSVLRQLTGIRDGNLEYVRDIIHNELDVFEDKIIANEDCIEFESLIDNDSDNEDYLD